ADGMADTWEDANGLDSTIDDSADDPDGDRRTNLDEFEADTDPQSYDGPDAPILLAPIGGDEVDLSTPELSWTNATSPLSEVLTYDVEVYEDAGLAVLLDSTTALAEDASGTTAWTPSNPAPENATAWWRARASDSMVDGTWTDLESFFVNALNEAPSVPAPAAPLEGDSVDTATPLLSWSEASDPDGDALTYDLRIWDGTVLSVVASATGLSDLEWTSDVLVEDTTYAWEVQATDDDGMSSGYSAAQQFFVDTTNSAPSDVVWVAPLDGDIVEPVDPQLEVSVSVDAEGEELTYVFELDLVSSFDSADLLSFGAEDELWDLAADGIELDENVTWFARVRVEDARGAASAWTQISFFVRGPNDPPAAPALVAPEDELEQVDGDSAPVFVVGHTVDPEGDPTTYGFTIATDEALTNVVEDTTDLAEGAGPEGTADQTSWQPALGFGPGVYYWTATATDDSGASADADEVWSFEVSGGGDDDDATGDDDDATG
ncbi:MAG: hypothetical protein GY913_13600, partial [Proteobacteria bacterium]|nr:hypothetical protein [Pseudomonadota bacterium]